MVQTQKYEKCERWCNRLKNSHTDVGIKQSVMSPINRKEYGRWKYGTTVDVGNETLGRSPLCQSLTDSWHRWCKPLPTGYQVSAPGLRARELVAKQPLVPVCCQMPQQRVWQGCTICPLKPSPKSVPSFGAGIKLKHKNTQLVVAYSILANSHFHLLLYQSVFFSFSPLCLVIIPRKTLHFAYDMPEDVIFSVKDVIFFHSTLCLLLLEQTLAEINSNSQEAVWLICFVLSTDLSPQLWAQIKLPHCLCAWIRHQSPCKSRGVSKSIKESHSAQEIA